MAGLQSQLLQLVRRNWICEKEAAFFSASSQSCQKKDYILGFTLHSCWPWLSSSKGCLVKHLLHANNAVGSFVELILPSTGLFTPARLLCRFSPPVVFPKIWTPMPFFWRCLKPPTNTAKSLQGEQGMRENGLTNRKRLSPEFDQSESSIRAQSKMATARLLSTVM